MALSPSVAPHPASRRRSYARLQAGVGIPGEDFHLPDRLRLQAHDTGGRRHPPERKNPPERTALLIFCCAIRSGALPSNPDELVAIGVTKISEISAIWALARRILDRCAAIRNAGFVPRFGLRRILHHKPDRAAVSLAGRLAINRLGHHEPAAIVRVSQSASGVLSAGLSAHRGKQGIIEFLRPGDIVTPDHDVAKHYVLSS